MGIIFDLDGTLIDSLELHAELVKKALDKVIGRDAVSVSAIRDIIRIPSSRFFPLLNAEYNLGLSQTDYGNILSIKDSLMTADSVKKLNFCAGMTEVVDLIKHNALKMAIATAMNSRELSLFIPAMGLKNITNVIVNPDSPDREKPDPYILDVSISRLGMDKGKTTYIGDALLDREAAERAGIRFIGLFNKELADSKLFFDSADGLYKYIETHIGEFKDR